MTGFNIVSPMRDVWKTAVSSSKLLATRQILHRISHGFWMQTGGAERQKAEMRAVANLKYLFNSLLLVHSSFSCFLKEEKKKEK